MDPEVAGEIEAQHVIIQRAMDAVRGKESMTDNPLVVMLRARQKIELLKLPTFVELTEKYIRAGKHIVWFLNFNETKKLLTKKILSLRTDPNDPESPRLLRMTDIDFIDGMNTPSEREEIRNAFQRDELKVLICQIRAGGVGISLHDLIGDHARVSLISPTWSAIELHQALGRIYRSSAKTDAKQRIIYCKPAAPAVPAAPTAPAAPAALHGIQNLMGAEASAHMEKNDERAYTIEEDICKNVNGKLRNILLLNEGDLTGYRDLV
jgi:hypothetical protein